MPLSEPVAREAKHTRHIECCGYKRVDGLWDIEGHLVDTKTYPFVNKWRGEVTPGVPVHEMWVRLTVDEDLFLHAIEAATDFSPYQICPQAAAGMQALIGLKLSTGWMKAVKTKLGGAAGCTHLIELMGPVATTAFQTIMPIRYQEALRRGISTPARVDSCYALGADRQIRDP